MRHPIATAATWGLALLIGATASAQSDKQGGSAKGSQGDNQKQKDSGQSNQSNQSTRTVRGELAGVSVVGETMVDSTTGRGVVAEMTYLTILGSPSGGGHDPAQGSQRKDDGSNKDQGDHGSSNGQMSGRRQVFEIAIGPETRVRDRSKSASQGSDDKKGSAKEQSQAALERLELGDRVEMEFARLDSPGDSGSGGNADQGSANRRRHGRHRIVRGVARSITILSAPDHNSGQSGSGDHRGGDASKGSNSSSGDKSSGSGSKDKDSDQSK